MRRAFTLIELLVVIAIIALLAAILFPVFSRAKAAAKASACISNLKQLGSGFALYLGDSDGVYPAAYGNRFPTSAWVLSGNSPLVGTSSPPCTTATDTYDLCAVADPTRGSLYAYTKNADIYKCPHGEDGKHKATGDPVHWSTNRLTYGMNYLLGGTDVEAPNGGRGQTGASESVVVFPSATFLLVDEDVVTRNDGLFVWTSKPATDEVGAQHFGGANMLHIDSSVKRYPAKAVRLDGSMRHRFRVQREEE